MRHLSGLTQALNWARAEDRAERGLSPLLPGHAGIGRRALLKSMAAAMAAAGCTPQLRGTQLVGEVAIVGGGLAGLVALDRLSAAGIAARLYEGRPKTGGRMLTRSDFPAKGRWVEIGGQLINTDHADMIALAKDLDLALLDAKAAGGSDQVLIGTDTLDRAGLVDALRPIAEKIAQDSERLDADWEAAAPDLDRISVSDYLDRHAKLLGGTGVRALLEQTVRTEFGVEPDAASALLLIFNLPTVDGKAYEVLGASDERYTVDGGSQRITDALTERHRKAITTGAKLSAITRTKDNLTQLKFADGKSVDASHVILALPAGILAGIEADGVFSTPWQAFHREVKLGRNGKFNAGYSSAPWRASPMGAGGTTWQAGSDPRFCETWDAAPAQAGAEAALTWFFGGKLIERMDQGTARAALERAHGSVGSSMGDMAGAFSGQVLRTGWHRDPFTGGAYSTFAPGQLTRFGEMFWVEEDDSSITQEARDGSIWFAGEHLSDAFAGYMNGAAQTGRLAAESIRAALA